MKGQYYLNRLKVRDKRSQSKELDVGLKKRVISEREYDLKILGNINGKINLINELENQIKKSVRAFAHKDREKGYEEIRLVFYEDEKGVWYDSIPKKVGFLSDDSI